MKKSSARKKQSRKEYPASLTVEAALVLPMFLAVIMTFLFFFQMIGFQLYFYQVIAKTAQETAQYGYVLQLLDSDSKESGEIEEQAPSDGDVAEEDSDAEESGTKAIVSLLLEQFDIESLLNDTKDSYLVKSLAYLNTDQVKVQKAGIVNGWSGISFWGSTVKDDDDCIVITAEYRMKIPFFSDLLPSVPVTQRIKVRNFTGYQPELQAGEEEAEDDQKYVYVAENGSVYHTSSQCSYLDITTSEVTLASLDYQRNQYMEAYKPCEKCIESNQTYFNVFITKTGNRYHSSTSCSALKRTYYKVLLSEVEGMNLCSRCKAAEEKAKEEAEEKE